MKLPKSNLVNLTIFLALTIVVAQKSYAIIAPFMIVPLLPIIAQLFGLLSVPALAIGAIVSKLFKKSFVKIFFGIILVVGLICLGILIYFKVSYPYMTIL